ncbi:MAG: hypothetical protein SWJ54_24450, partial [Cyanobacteriota bacterium]|nr:hypothetical protein [Cyanobacteriota bacterium]
DYKVSEMNTNQFRLTHENSSESPAFILWFLNTTPVSFKSERFVSKGQPPFSEHQLLRFEMPAINPHFLALFITETDYQQMKINAQANFQDNRVFVELSSIHQSDRLEFGFYNFFRSDSEQLFHWKRNSQ